MPPRNENVTKVRWLGGLKLQSCGLITAAGAPLAVQLLIHCKWVQPISQEVEGSGEATQPTQTGTEAGREKLRRLMEAQS